MADKKTAVLILGATGMAGFAATDYFLNQPEKYHTYINCRDKEKGERLAEHFGQIILGQYLDANSPADDWIKLFSSLNHSCLKNNYKDVYVLNMCGLTNRHSDLDKINTINVNSIFPIRIAELCKIYGFKFIHISTNCVFSSSSNRRGYFEDDIPNPSDLYGQTKLVGENADGMIIRTSIIGEEFETRNNLCEWLKWQDSDNHGGERQAVKGWTKTGWNGVTTKALAQCIDEIITENKYRKGLVHLNSPNFVNKCELLYLLKKKFGLDVEIIPDNSVKENRMLHQMFPPFLKIPTIQKQIEGM
jgi:dTDP-4-dehydrorhamnose reductase